MGLVKIRDVHDAYFLHTRKNSIEMRHAQSTSGEEAFRPKPLGANVPVLNQTGSNGGHWSRFVIQTGSKGLSAGRGRLCQGLDAFSPGLYHKPGPKAHPLVPVWITNRDKVPICLYNLAPAQV
jgi:hypothetical protein